MDKVRMLSDVDKALHDLDATETQLKGEIEIHLRELSEAMLRGASTTAIESRVAAARARLDALPFARERLMQERGEAEIVDLRQRIAHGNSEVERLNAARRQLRAEIEAASEALKVKQKEDERLAYELSSRSTEVHKTKIELSLITGEDHNLL